MEENPDDDVYQDTLESIQIELESKVENVAKFIKEMEYENEAIKSEIDRIKKRYNSNEKKINWFKDYLQQELTKADLKKIKTPLFTISIAANKESVEEINMALIPHYYYNSETSKLDKKQVLSDIKNGTEIKGVKIVQTESLRMR